MKEPRYHVRVDNRLLHGQVVQFWLPRLEVDRLVIADDETAGDESLLSVYRMALDEQIALAVVPVHRLQFELEEHGEETVFVLLADICDAARAEASGVVFQRLTLGNVHAAPGRSRVTDAVYLSAEELAALVRMRKNGSAVEVQTFPGDTLKLEVDDDGEARWTRH
jgi:mannose/fructose/N-acetylgalactosamine-specific phosphotransferase system component IIB